MLAMSLLRRLGRGAILLPSHAGDVAAEVTCSQCDVSTESCCMTGVRIYDRSYDVRSKSGCTNIISMYNEY
jgi:hypothetical protein